uniref:Target of Nesh-SH3 isoform X7 n=1 Tax=Geotrypetes seraphini TaxID=260995 RepID=A0A6P8RDK9_GEOSA|nr:target of Nesh-SH3 isoform X7 [Geotrypetes seraphini]
MLSRLLFLLIFGNIAEYLGNAQKLPRAKRQSLKVQINATDDTIALKFLRPSPNMQLEGFILGYGSNFFSSQYIPLPDHGKSYETEVDAEPRYLISVKPAANPKKSCSGKKNSQKPLQVVVGTLSPTSVFLSWGVLVNPQHDWAVMNNCPSDRFYTVRYREKDKTKKWLFQLCPASETVIDNLKPNTMYEFGVKDNSEEGVWNKAVNHKTSIPSKNKENGQIQNTYKIPKGLIQMAPDDMKTLIAIQVIKQVIQNATNMKHFKLKPTVGPSPPEAIPVVAEKAPESIKATVSTGVDLSKVAPAHSESKTKSLEPDTSTQQPASTQVPNNLQYDPSSPENSKTQEILQPESAVNVAHLPARPKTSNLPDLAETKPAATSQIILESIPSENLNTLEWVRATRVTSILKMSTATYQTTQEPAAAKTSTILREPELTMAPIETQFTHSPRIISTSPETSPVSTDPQFTSSETDISSNPEKLKAILVAHQTTQESLTSETSIPLQQSITTLVEENSLPSAITSQTLPRTILAPALTSEQPAATLSDAVSEKQLIPSLPKASVRPEMSHTKTAISENQLIPSLPKTSVRPEMSHTKPATTSQTLPGTILAPALTSEQPVATLSNAISEKQLIPSLPKASVRPDMSHTKPAISEKQLIPSLPKASVRPEMSQTKPVTTSQTLPGTILAPSFTSEQPAVTLGNGMFSLKPALIESLVLPSQPKITSRPEIPQTKPESTSLPITKPVTDKPSDTIKQEQSTQAAYRKIGHPLTTKSPVISERQRTTMAPKTIHIAPSKPKPSSRPGAPQTKPVPNETQKPIEPEITQTSESSHTRAVPNETQPKIASSSSKPKTRQTTETPYTRVVPNVTQRTASSVPKTTMRPHSRSAPRETITEPVMSKLPVLPQRPKATLGPYRGHFRSPRPRTSARPWTRPAVNGTTQGSVRTKPSDGFNWLPDRPVSPIWLASSGESRKDGRLAGLDISKLLGVSRNTSMDPNNTRKGLVSGPSPSQRVFLSPTRHTYTRRRPYPFNNMTGRPGGPGTVMPRIMRFTAKPTQFSVARRTQMPKKQPTFPTSELEDANDTIFNPKPISELDPQGKPRFTGSHVKYIRKDDHVPCSITESIKHFPVEEASNQDITSAPQNPPSNLTIVTVEGCPSFVILDWEQPDNDTVTEYEVISKENGGPTGHDQSILTTNQTHSTVENLKPDTSYEFKVKPKNPLGEGPPSNTVAFSTESADPRVSEFISGGKDAIWTEFPFKSDGFSECKGKQYVKRTWYKKFVGIQLCNSLRYKIYLSDSLTGKFYNVGDQRGHGEDHCQFVDSFLDGRTGQHLLPDQLPTRKGYYRAFRQQPVEFGKIGRDTQINYVHWYECGTTIPGKW